MWVPYCELLSFDSSFVRIPQGILLLSARQTHTIATTTPDSLDIYTHTRFLLFHFYYYYLNQRHADIRSFCWTEEEQQQQQKYSYLLRPLFYLIKFSLFSFDHITLASHENFSIKELCERARRSGNVIFIQPWYLHCVNSVFIYWLQSKSSMFQFAIESSAKLNVQIGEAQLQCCLNH